MIFKALIDVREDHGHQRESVEDMFATIPLLSLFLICAFFHLRKLSRGEVETPCWRTAVLAGGITWGVILVFGTEMLSLLGAFSFEWVLAFWALTALVGAIACVAFYVRARRWRSKRRPIPGTP